jgi:hypothetical protein
MLDSPIGNASIVLAVKLIGYGYRNTPSAQNHFYTTNIFDKQRARARSLNRIILIKIEQVLSFVSIRFSVNSEKKQSFSWFMHQQRSEIVLTCRVA